MLSVIIPTIGRPSLAATLKSVTRQLWAEDEVLVVSDGFIAEVKELCALFESVYYLYTPEQTKDSGASQRDLGIASAIGSHLMFLDDDDIYLSDAVLAIRAAIAADEEAVFIFRMKYGGAANHPGLVLWADPEVRNCNIGTPMLVVPNTGYLRPWAGLDPVCHDYHWARWLSDNRRVIFQPAIVALIRPSPDDYLREDLT